MAQRDSFAQSLKAPPAPSVSDLRVRYFRLHAQHGKKLWLSPDGRQLLQDLERDDLREVLGDFVFACPQTLTLYWDLIDYLDWGCRHYLVIGERGVGKDTIAQCIAKYKGRKLISINCATLVDSIADSLLFGISGTAGLPQIPREGTQGFIGAANGQVLFLDEFFDAPRTIFPKLLRLLQEPRCFQRVGDSREQELAKQTIIVAASNRYPTIAALHASMLDGEVRSDLVDRFEARLEVPPLRERHREIGDIANNLLKRLPSTTEYSSLSASTVQALRHCGHDWPGNVRELEQLLAAQARLQRHSARLGCELEISAQTMRDWVSDATTVEWSNREPTLNPPAAAGVSAWDKHGHRTLRLNHLLTSLHSKRTEAGVGQVNLRWVSAALRQLFRVDNISQKLKDSLGLNLGELTSFLNEFSGVADGKLDEMTARTKGRRTPK